MNSILDTWKQPIDESALPTLIHHVVHIGGGFVVRDIVLSFPVSGILFPVSSLVATIVSLALFFTVEIVLTGPIKTFYYIRAISDATVRRRAILAHWKDCLFDFQQYAFQIVMYPLSLGDIASASVLLVMMLALYFILLRSDW